MEFIIVLPFKPLQSDDCLRLKGVLLLEREPKWKGWCGSGLCEWWCELQWWGPDELISWVRGAGCELVVVVGGGGGCWLHKWWGPHLTAAVLFCLVPIPSRRPADTTPTLWAPSGAGRWTRLRRSCWKQWRITETWSDSSEVNLSTPSHWHIYTHTTLHAICSSRTLDHFTFLCSWNA